MTTRNALLTDKDVILGLLDQFRADCIEQVTGEPASSDSARTGGAKIFETLLSRPDYCAVLLVDSDSTAVGIITGYLCPMLRNGDVRAEVEEFFVKKEFRGNQNAKMLMDGFFEWCKSKHVVKVNLESENQLLRAHSFYKNMGLKQKLKDLSRNCSVVKNSYLDPCMPLSKEKLN